MLKFGLAMFCYGSFLVLAKCKASTNGYGKYATITSSLLLWFIYYSTQRTAKYSLKTLMWSIIQWCVHWLKHPDLSRDTVYSGCNNPVIAMGVDDLQHVCVGVEALEAALLQGWLHPDSETVIGHSLHVDLSAFVQWQEFSSHGL